MSGDKSGIRHLNSLTFTNLIYFILLFITQAMRLESVSAVFSTILLFADIYPLLVNLVVILMIKTYRDTVFRLLGRLGCVCFDGYFQTGSDCQGFHRVITELLVLLLWNKVFNGMR
jgi:hypothetical protein